MRLGVKKEHLWHSNVMTFSLPAPKWGSLAPANVEAHLPLTCVRPGTRPQSTFRVCVVAYADLNNVGLCSMDSLHTGFFGPGWRDGEQVEDEPGAPHRAVLRPPSSLIACPLAWPLCLLDPPSTRSCSPLSLTFYILGDEGVMRLIFSPTAHQTEPQMRLILQWMHVLGLRSGNSTKVMTTIFFLVF